MENLFKLKINLFYFKLLLLLICVKNICGSEYGQLVDYVSLPYRDIRNLSCTSHETKFTCDCSNTDETLNLLPLPDGQAYQVSITNCKSLIVGTDFIRNLKGIRNIEFYNVQNLILKENSLSFPQLSSNVPPVLKFNQVQIEQIDSHAINGKIGEIIFSFGTIGTIRPYGIDTKYPDCMIKFESMFIDRIEPQAFKKFSIDKLEIINSVITSNLPTRSFYDIKINNLLQIQNVTFKEVYTNAFMLEDVSKLVIMDNNFDVTNGEWISSPIKASVLIQNNNFGLTSVIAFKGLTVHKDFKQSEYLDLRFFNNKINQSDLKPLPLEFNSRFSLNLKDLTYLNKFSCHLLNKNKNNDNNKHEKQTLFDQFKDTIYFQSNKNNITLNLNKLYDLECKEISYLSYIIGGSVALLIIIIFIIILIIYLIRKRKAKKQKLDIVVPEPRTYKETQIVLQIENAGLLKTDL